MCPKGVLAVWRAIVGLRSNSGGPLCARELCLPCDWRMREPGRREASATGLYPPDRVLRVIVPMEVCAHPSASTILVLRLFCHCRSACGGVDWESESEVDWLPQSSAMTCRGRTV